MEESEFDLCLESFFAWNETENAKLRKNNALNAAEMQA